MARRLSCGLAPHGLGKIGAFDHEMPVESKRVRDVSDSRIIRLTLEQEFPSSMEVRARNGAFLALQCF